MANPYVATGGVFRTIPERIRLESNPELEPFVRAYQERQDRFRAVRDRLARAAIACRDAVRSGRVPTTEEQDELALASIAFGDLARGVEP